jgi:hypothetical protein
MTELNSALYRFLTLPIALIKNNETCARKVAISGFKATNSDPNLLLCYKNTAHTLNASACIEEIYKVLNQHVNCATTDDFPSTLHLNYCSHRHLTFLTDEPPRSTISYSALAEHGFTFAK